MGLLSILEMIVGLGSQIFGIFAAKSKEAPVVGTLAPFAVKAMQEAENIFGSGNGAAKLQHVQTTLQEVVNAGLAVTTGGAQHTMQEFNTALPVITEAINGIVSLVNSVQTKSVIDIVAGYLTPPATPTGG